MTAILDTPAKNGLPKDGGADVLKALKRFATAVQGSRRFHRELIGRGVNPEHCFGDFLLSVARARSKNFVEERAGKNRLDSAYKTAMSVTASGATGGYLVPSELHEDLMHDVAEEAFVRPLAIVMPMATQTLILPWPDAETATGSAGVPPFFGAINMTWTEEAQSIPETEPKLRAIELRANELTGYALASNPLMQDSLGIETWLRRLFSRGIAWFEDFAFLQGNGVAKPLGVLNSGAAIQVTRNGANLVKYVDMAAMAAKLLPFSYLHASWLITVSATIQVFQLIDASGKTAWTPNFPAELQDGAAGNRSVGVVFGRPTFITEKLPALGTLGDVMVVDFSLYIIGDRQEVSIDVSHDVLTPFLANQSAWRVTERVDGKPLFDNTITLSDSATVVSPIVVLK